MRSFWRFLALVVLLSPVFSFADTPSSAVTGIWMGTMRSVNVAFLVSQNPDQSLKVLVRRVDWTAQEIQTLKVTFKDKTLRFEAPDVGATFDGDLSPDGSHLNGIWRQGEPYTVNLKKTDELPTAETMLDAKDIDGLKPEIDKLVAPLIKGGWEKAVGVGVIYKGQKRVWGYGNAAAKGKKSPDGDTGFELGSISKLFTRLMFIDMILKGKMKLDDPAQMYLPSDVKMPTYNGKQITLCHLAQHMSGLPFDPDDMFSSLDENPHCTYTLTQLYNYLSRYQLTREPGSKYDYSNTGLALLGDLIASKSGITYPAYFEHLVSEPLGLKDTSVYWTEEQRARAAQGYNGDGEPVSLRVWTQTTYMGAGAVHSTLNDLLQLAQGLFEPTSGPLAKLTSYAWADQLSWGDIVTHDGLTNQFNSSFYADRIKQCAVVVWGNEGNVKASALANEVRKLVQGAKPAPLKLPKLVLKSAAQLRPYVGRYRIEQVLPKVLTLEGRTYQVAAKKGHLVGTDEVAKRSAGLYFTSEGELLNKNGTMTFYLPIKDGQGRVVGLKTKPGQAYSMTFSKLDDSGEPVAVSQESKGKSEDSNGTNPSSVKPSYSPSSKE